MTLSYNLVSLLIPSSPNVVSGPKPQSQGLLEIQYHNLLNSSHDSGENDVLFLKIRARVLELWLDTSSGPSLPKCSL